MVNANLGIPDSDGEDEYFPTPLPTPEMWAAYNVKKNKDAKNQPPQQISHNIRQVHNDDECGSLHMSLLEGRPRSLSC